MPAGGVSIKMAKVGLPAAFKELEAIVALTRPISIRIGKETVELRYYALCAGSSARFY